MKPSALKENEFSPYFGRYINQAPDLTISEGLELGKNEVIAAFKSLPEEKHEYRYAPGKWTLKEMLVHMIDTERIFAYRALRIARGDKQALAGYDQDDYVLPSKANDRSMENILMDYSISKANTQALFHSFDGEMLTQIGTASGGHLSCRAAGFIIIGHELHHLKVMNERY